jgi:hypothetical protein
VDEPTARAVGPDDWFYAIDGTPLGPVPAEWVRLMLERKQLLPCTPVWRPGLADWQPAASVPALGGGQAVSPRDLMSPEQLRQARIVRNAKINAVAMFVVFIVGVLVSGGTLALRLNGVLHTGYACLITPVTVASVFAAIYVPIRWRALKESPVPFSTLGLIGGIGLALLLIGWLAAFLLLGLF